MAQTQNSNPHVKPLEQAMAARFGWQAGASWRDTLLDAIRRKGHRLGMDELSYSRIAVQSPAELEALAEIVTNSETRFFREPEQFAALKSRILPELISARGKERRLDLWSAACSTGEEPYSLGILLGEALPAAADWKINLYATDLRGPALISASKGRYPSSSIGMIDPDLRRRYFVKVGTNGRDPDYDVVPSLRSMVAFRRANLYDANFWKNLGQQFDLIVCNNLLLYFHALAVKQTVERIANVLKPGGLLMVMRNEAGYVGHPRMKLEHSLPGSFFRKI